MGLMNIDVERRRYRRGFCFWARLGLISQLSIGMCLIALHAQQRPFEEVIAVDRQETRDRMSSIEARLKRYDEMQIAERLAVLDSIQKEGHDAKMLGYGTMLALLGNLALGLVERRRKPRG